MMTLEQQRAFLEARFQELVDRIASDEQPQFKASCRMLANHFLRNLEPANGSGLVGLASVLTGAAGLILLEDVRLQEEREK